MENYLPRRRFLQAAGLAAAGSLVMSPQAGARPAERAPHRVPGF